MPSPADIATLIARFMAGVDDVRPGAVIEVAARVAGDLVDARDLVLFLVNLEGTELVPADAGAARPHALEGTPAGLAFTSGEPVVHEIGERRRVWVPVEVGADRLGVLELDLPEDAVPAAAPFARAVGRAVRLKQAYGDELELTRRSQDMSVGAELLTALVPPLDYSDSTVVVSALLEPSYSSGGDAIDYAVNDGVLHLAVLDAMGHGFPAAMVSAVALTAYRNARRLGQDLAGTYDEMDSFVSTFATDGRFVTAIMAELETDTGRLTWVSAGHPAPLVVRAGARTAESLRTDPVPPLGTGLALGAPTVQEDFLEPGDLLALYSDGLTEARNLDGDLTGLLGLGGLLAARRSAGDGPQALVRRIRRELATNDQAWLSDDASAILVEWRDEATPI